MQVLHNAVFPTVVARLYLANFWENCGSDIEFVGTLFFSSVGTKLLQAKLASLGEISSGVRRCAEA